MYALAAYLLAPCVHMPCMSRSRCCQPLQVVDTQIKAFMCTLTQLASVQ